MTYTGPRLDLELVKCSTSLSRHLFAGDAVGGSWRVNCGWWWWWW
ncbi:hypothetical protein E2C01_084839 [Portunus trituberculatus]|uniref:Uncharacterized protein n=1 Tax=Portunus trituberculatus TaxID=210409 RepID=A0A5B7J8U0_PORTR|nr:hypothetical protein [Portunus trituberculatus]